MASENRCLALKKVVVRLKLRPTGKCAPHATKKPRTPNSGHRITRNTRRFGDDKNEL